MQRDEFARLVKEALTHLYDHPYLQRHPLSSLLLSDAAREVSGLTLHRVLVQTIEALRPSPRVPPSAPTWRPYLALFLRYVENMDAAQVAQELGVSPRQFRREHLRGLEALIDLLWDRWRQEQTGTPDASSSSLLEAEVARLSTTSAAGTTTVDAAVRSVLATLEGLARHQRVSLAVTLPSDLPPVALDRVVMRQILLSVLTHAMSHRTDSAVEVSATSDASQVTVAIRVEGGSQDIAPFNRADDRLRIAQRLIEAQEGKMEVEEGEELVVRLTLPARRLPIVLVIDDNPDVIQLFQRYLAGGPYRVLGASTSEEALRLAAEVVPDAITLDVMMPTQDGWELLQSFKNHPIIRKIPVIVCSVLRERALALSLGAEEFLAKPVTQAMLLTALARCVPLQAGAGRPAPTADSASAPQSRGRRDG